jgi:hypothetical protein
MPTLDKVTASWAVQLDAAADMQLVVIGSYREETVVNGGVVKRDEKRFRVSTANTSPVPVLTPSGADKRLILRSCYVLQVNAAPVGFRFLDVDAGVPAPIVAVTLHEGEWLAAGDGDDWYVMTVDGRRKLDTYSIEIPIPPDELIATTIPSAEAFGTPRLVEMFLATTIPSAEAFGTPDVTGDLHPDTIPSAEAFGTPRLVERYDVGAGSIPSAEAFGTPHIFDRFAPTTIPSAETFGTPQLVQPMTPTTIPSAEAFGTPRLVDVFAASTIPSAEAFGEPYVTSPDPVLMADPCAAQVGPMETDLNFLVPASTPDAWVAFEYPGPTYPSLYILVDSDLATSRVGWKLNDCEGTEDAVETGVPICQVVSNPFGGPLPTRLYVNIGNSYLTDANITLKVTTAGCPSPPPPPPPASPQGPNFGTGGDDATLGTTAWTNPTNIAADDGSYATALSATPHYLTVTNLGFSLPSGAVIDGIEVKVEGSISVAGRTVTPSAVRLIKGGTISATSRHSDDLTAFTTTDSVRTFGSSTTNPAAWGETLTDTDVNASNFGVGFRYAFTGGSGVPTVRIDYITVKIWFH